MPELLIGCGNSRDKRVGDASNPGWNDLTTLDIDPHSGADVIHDLNTLPYPFADDHFDEIHAYEVLEHTGQQGDWRFFLAQFSEFWRILKPGGLLCATCPSVTSRWAWGDPGHTRLIQPETLVFLQQPRYEQVGRTAMTDYRAFYQADFDLAFSEDNGQGFKFALRAIKPSRIQPKS
jgi:SAM-dependent methyltransferase